jgi:hypothetical protein
VFKVNNICAVECQNTSGSFKGSFDVVESDLFVADESELLKRRKK